MLHTLYDRYQQGCIDFKAYFGKLRRLKSKSISPMIRAVILGGIIGGIALLVNSLPAPLSQQAHRSPTATPVAAKPVHYLPAIQYKLPRRQLTATVFGYSSTVDQTDGDPFTTASGRRVDDHTIATNCLPFGTQVTIPNLFGDKVFVVTDRMAAWHGCGTFDVWHASRAAARQFGKHRVVVEVL